MEHTTHPSWCDQDGCNERGEHRSRRMSAAMPNGLNVESFLASAVGGPDTGEPVIVVTIERTEHALFLGQGRMLGHQLRKLADLTKDAPRHANERSSL